MKCTSCNDGYLEPRRLDGLFDAQTCNVCGGNWILIEDYLSWKERNPDYEFDTDVVAQEIVDTPDETKSALLCPVTGRLMTKFRLSAHSNHKIDYSQAVAGIWLDKGEWELMKHSGIANSLNAVLTEHWQKDIRTANAHDSFAALYESKFGTVDYHRVREMRRWLEAHPDRDGLRAYLLADDPYSAER